MTQRHNSRATTILDESGWVRLGVVLLLASPIALFLVARLILGLAGDFLELRFPPPGQLVAVGSHRLHWYCLGNGRPPVVIESGLGVDWTSWADVVMPLAESTRVCVYDRAGYGWSERGPMPRTAAQIATELREAMAATLGDGPYVLVAHSFGGSVARVYAARYAATLGAVVLVDPVEEADRLAEAAAVADRPPAPLADRLLELVPPLGWDRVKRLHRGESGLQSRDQRLPVAFRYRVVVNSSLHQVEARTSEQASGPETEQQVRVAVFPDTVPLTIVTPLYRRSPGQPGDVAGAPGSTRRHRGLLESSAHARQVVAERSGHFVMLDQPDLLVALIHDSVVQVRSAQTAANQSR